MRSGAPPPANVLRVLYVLEPGRQLSARQNAFSVLEDGREILAVHADRIDRIEIGPYGSADDGAVRLALASETALAYVNGWGQTLGTLSPPVTPHAGLHLAQARVAFDADARIDLARRIVEGRLRNQRALLQRLKRRHAAPGADAAVAGIGRAIRRLPAASAIEELMGIEGEAASRYWPSFGEMLGLAEPFRRRRRPPPDPVNLVLSFVGALLYRDLGVLAARHGLHPGLGALHAARNGHDGCLSDLIEEFRAPLVEGLTVFLFNNRALTGADFESVADPDVADGMTACSILPEGRRAVIRGYEKWLARPVQRPRTGERVSWRGLVEDQAVAYARHVSGTAPYRPYVMDY